MSIPNAVCQPILRRSYGLFVLAGVLAVALLAPAGARGQTDVRKLQAIVTAPEPTELEARAARELAGYLKKMYGVTLPVQARKDIGANTTGVILLGKDAAVAGGAITEAELKAVRWDGYVIKARGGRLALAGPRGLATLFAVSGLLEHLGARFYGVMETVPQPDSTVIADFALSDKPAYEFRFIRTAWQLKTSNLHGIGRDWADPRKGANPELFTPEAGSDLWIDHSAAYLVPKLLYYDKHPEYYALLRSGKRIAKDKFTDHRTPLCLSNPDVMRISIERMLQWIEKNPEKRFFGVTYGDTRTWCACEKCRKLDGAKGHADRLLHWVNGIARAVGKTHPDKVFVTHAYLSTQPAPSRVRPEPNVIVLYTPWYGQSIMGRRHPYTTCWESVIAATEMEGWLKVGPSSLGIYDYSLNRDLPQLHSREHEIKLWAKRGRRAFWQLGGGKKKFKALEDYVHARLLWDPSLDARQVEREFCDAYYGPAGKFVHAYINAWYHEMVDTGTHKLRGDPAYPAKALKLLEQMTEAAKGTPYAKRVQNDLRAFHQAKYCKDIFGGSLEEFRARLAKGDWGTGEYFQPIEPEKGYEGYDREHLWLSKPRIHRRKFKHDWKLTRLEAIHTGGGAAGDLAVARKLQGMLKEIYGITLPVNPKPITIDTDTKGVILVGKRAALASGLITEADFATAGPDGAIARGLDGRVALAATRADNTAAALQPLLYILRKRHGGTETAGENLPKSRVPILREFTFLDWPPFGAVYTPESARRAAGRDG